MMVARASSRRGRSRGHSPWKPRHSVPALQREAISGVREAEPVAAADPAAEPVRAEAAQRRRTYHRQAEGVYPLRDRYLPEAVLPG